MSVDVSEEPIAALAEYARVPIAFDVHRVLDLAVPDDGLGGVVLSERSLDVPYLSERSLDVPYLKGYDAPDGGPTRWATRFDVSRWGAFAARADGRRVGGAVVAFDTAGLDMLERRSDLA